MDVLNPGCTNQLDEEFLVLQSDRLNDEVVTVPREEHEIVRKGTEMIKIFSGTWRIPGTRKAGQ